jgi:hypothetical protein
MHKEGANYFWLRSKSRPTKNVWNAYSFKASTSKIVLNECNGRIQLDSTYGYHATLNFSIIVDCLKGTPKTQTGAAAAQMPAMGGNNQQTPRSLAQLEHPHLATRVRRLQP